jgi:uncharacterized membrane protein YhaH (DUF805 family)
MSIFQFLFSFQGRISRTPLWLLYLGMCVLVAVLFVLLHNGVITGHGVKWTEKTYDDHGMMQHAGAASDQIRHVRVFTLLSAEPWLALVGLLFAWIKLAVLVKRWHDRDKSGWWVLIALVPIIGPIWQGIECFFLPGTEGSNRYGPSPK